MSEPTAAPDRPRPNRRDALKKAAAVVVGGVVATVPLLAGLLVFLNPLRPKRGGAAAAAGGATAGAAAAGAEGFIDVVPLSAVPPDGMPRRFQVLAERVDAWNKHPAAPVGAVFLKRDPATPDRVVAFNVVCPHAGCSVESRPGGSFLCPCHNSAFHPDGSPAPGCVSPRGLDELDVDPDGLRAGAIRVKFQNFISGTHDKRPQT